MINIHSYEIKNLLLTNELLTSYISKFWEEIFTSLLFNSKGKDKHLMLLCKVQFADDEMGYRTLGPLRKVNFNDRELFNEYLIQRLGLLTESYVTHPICKLHFSYIIKSGLAPQGNRTLLQNYEDKVSSTTHRFNNLMLPITMKPEEYGKIIIDNYIQINGNNIHRFVVESGTKSYVIDVNPSGLTNNVRIQGPADLSWIDTQISEGVFKREIGKSIIFFMNGEKVLRKKVLTAKPFKKVGLDTEINNNFITMDIETIKDESNNLIPYLVCAYNGSSYITSYANDNLNQTELLSSFIKQLLTFFTKDSNNLNVYAHNLSGFDGIFLMKHLLSLGKVDPLLFNGKLMSIKVKLTNVVGFKNKTIIFKDSYLLLPQSLRNLCVAFNIESSKGYFPLKLTNIFYTGLLPKFEYWTGIDLNTYESLVSNFINKEWNFKDEAIKYCKLDCKSLHEILIKFNKLIFSHFNINAINPKVLTLPGLAMKIYRSQFMKPNTIYQLLGSVERDIRQSYTGGAVDVYIPHNRKNIISIIVTYIKALFIKLYSYDVNSLYPYIMANTQMPIGKPMAFEGDITKIDPTAYGFFYCEIQSPEYLEHPILQRRIKTSEGIRTVAGLGTWTGWIFSEEMYNAMRFGYKFEIIRGYQFQKGNLFREYVNKMYALRLEYEKGHPMNLIAKLLMNSLYGKFAMKVQTNVVEMFDTSNECELSLFNEMLDKNGHLLEDYIKIDNHYLTIRKNMANYSYDENEDLYHGLDVNIAIGSAITAGGRMWMSLLKNNPLFNLYYSDTDSAVVDKQLPTEMVGNKLGQFKLEHIINRAVFLAPKVYALITDRGEEIIKIKGLTKDYLNGFNFSSLEFLLFKDSSQEFIQEKFFKKVLEGKISVGNIAYTLKVTSNKRRANYVKVNNLLIYNNTSPIKYDEIIITPLFFHNIQRFLKE